MITAGVGLATRPQPGAANLVDEEQGSGVEEDEP
jgi:hypothetical protein